jgi:hypothetical protein
MQRYGVDRQRDHHGVERRHRERSSEEVDLRQGVVRAADVAHVGERRVTHDPRGVVDDGRSLAVRATDKTSGAPRSISWGRVTSGQRQGVWGRGQAELDQLPGEASPVTLVDERAPGLAQADRSRPFRGLPLRATTPRVSDVVALPSRDSGLVRCRL